MGATPLGGMMQIDEAERRRESWGGKPCRHPRLDKEYYLGSATGDYVCTTCGEAGFGSDWPGKERARTKEQRAEGAGTKD